MHGDTFNMNFFIYETWRKLKLFGQNTNVLEIKTSILRSFPFFLSFFTFFVLNRPSTPLKGGLSNVWFDRFKISNDCPERLESINVMCEVLTDVIDDEVKSVIEKNRVLIGKTSKCW